jgi:predicted anti-sigma-YlaC factor YlaD
MLTCRHASRLLSNRLDCPLTKFERFVLGVHLLGCRPCRRFQQALGWLHASLAFVPDDVHIPSDARERIRLALEHAAHE